MTARPEILFLAHRIPYPPDKGDKIRSWKFLERLAQRYAVHLAAFVDDPSDFAHEAHLRRVCADVALAPLDPVRARARSLAALLDGRPLTYGFYEDRRMRAAVAAMRERPLRFEYAFSSSMTPYLEPARPGRPRIADVCDADSEKWREYAVESRFPMRWVYAREGRRLADAETAIVNAFDATIAISGAEAAILSGRAGARRAVETIGNGVDADHFAPVDHPRPDDAGDVAFVGAMDYRPNVDGVLWFAQEAWPEIRRGAPGATFSIIGSNPAPAIRALGGRDGVRVTGRVADVRPYLAAARLVIAPLKIARGVQNKVLEAMAAGRAIVATPAANVGIDAADGAEILIAEGRAAFAAAALRILADPGLAARLGAAARARAVAEFSWERQFRRLDSLISRLGVDGAPPAASP